MSWMYQLHMCYAWYSTWVFFVYCGHIGFSGGLWGSCILCVRAACELHVFLGVDQRNHCHLFHADFFLRQNYTCSFRGGGPCRANPSIFKDWYNAVQTVTERDSGVCGCGDKSHMKPPSLWEDHHLQSEEVLKGKEQPSPPHPTPRVGCLSRTCLRVWFLHHRFISLHCNAKQHIWNHLKVISQLISTAD